MGICELICRELLALEPNNFNILHNIEDHQDYLQNCDNPQETVEESGSCGIFFSVAVLTNFV